MKHSGSAAVVRALEDESIPFTFGIPGTHNIELYDALSESKSVEAVLVTDEQSASFMADAVWRSSGRLGCVNVVPGAGLTHAMSGIAEAYMDNVAMLVLGCGIRTDTGHAFQLHDVDQLAMVAPVTKARFRIETGEEIYATIRRACAIARGGVPGPVMVEVPANLYMIPYSGKDAADGAESPSPPALPDQPVKQAAKILDRARRPLLYLGLGAAPAGELLVELAERLEAPVSTTFQGKGVFPESHPLFVWPGFGDAAPKFARDVATECDATLAIGCRFSEVATGSYGLRPPEPLIHVDIEPTALDRNFEADVAIDADSRDFVRALLSDLGEKSADPALRRRIAEGHRHVQEAWRADAESKTDGVDPFLMLEALQRRFGQNTIYTSDSGNGTFLAVECLRLEQPGRLLSPVDYSCMGYSVPAAIGAALARPDAHVIALAGDGAFLMTGLELLTAATRNIPVLVIVLRDRELAQIAQFQAVALNRKVASRIADYDLGPLCKGLGVECVSLQQNNELDAALGRANEILESGHPCVIDAAIDYSRKTFFTRGIVKTNFLRLPWSERLRMATRAVKRKIGVRL